MLTTSSNYIPKHSVFSYLIVLAALVGSCAPLPRSSWDVRALHPFHHVGLAASNLAKNSLVSRTPSRNQEIHAENGSSYMTASKLDFTSQLVRHTLKIREALFWCARVCRTSMGDQKMDQFGGVPCLEIQRGTFFYHSVGWRIFRKSVTVVTLCSRLVFGTCSLRAC